MYNPSSPHAGDFIDHQEVLDSLEEARRESKNPVRVAQILEKPLCSKALPTGRLPS